MTAVTRTTCPYCGVGCGLQVTRDRQGEVAVSGDPSHPANLGRACSKGAALADTLATDERLLQPRYRGRDIGWDAALTLAADTFAQTIKTYGPDSVAFYVSGQLLTEDYYVANKLMKGFIGSGNIDTNSRLCMASAVAGHRRAFGSDTVPGVYRDLELADLVVLVGSNLAWCHPVLFQRLQAAKAARPEMTIVVIDPRRTMTARAADLHLAIAPGSDVALFNGLLRHLASTGRVDEDYVARHTQGMAEALAAAGALSLDEIAGITGLTRTELRRFYDLFAATERVVTGFSQGVNQSSNGTDKVNSIINCHLLTGRIGRPGMGPFSITGQPNAMGGREAGGLANQLACHLEIENPAHRQAVGDFWRAPHIARQSGLKAVDLFRAVRDGRIRAIWIAGTNPVDSLPEADDVQAALRGCDFVVVSDVMAQTDTARHAHLLLPAAAWGEKNGTVTNSERRISRQRSFLPLPGQAKPDWWIFAEVGKRMGWPEAFSYAGPAEIFREYAALSGIAAGLGRDFDISACANLSDAAYDALMPFQWPWPAGAQPKTEERFFADGKFFTEDGRARLVATPWRAPHAVPDQRRPFVLNTGRVRDQWHTMTRTALSARLMGHIAEPFAELHPADADALGIAPATLVRLENARGSILVRALITPDQQPGSIFVPLHWTDQVSSQARVDTLVTPATDAVSGQPELKFTPVSAAPYPAAWYGFAVLRQRPATIAAAYWALARASQGWRLELADASAPADWTAYARALFGGEGEITFLAYHDAAAAQHRIAAFSDDVLLGMLFVAADPVAVSRSWAAEQLATSFAAPASRLRLLAGRSGQDAPERGAVICACLNVGSRQISEAIAGGCRTIEAVGAATQAGTNCGSCRSEIGKLIDAASVQKAG